MIFTLFVIMAAQQAQAPPDSGAAIAGTYEISVCEHNCSNFFYGPLHGMLVLDTVRSRFRSSRGGLLLVGCHALRPPSSLEQRIDPRSITWERVVGTDSLVLNMWTFIDSGIGAFTVVTDSGMFGT